MTKVVLAIACAALVADCGESPARMSPLSPTPVIPIATAPPPPPYVPFFYQPFTEVAAGTLIQRKVDDSSNPECPGLPGFGCHYFRITPDRDGTLDIELTWVLESQPGQRLDLSHASAIGERDGDFQPPATERMTSRVKAGETSQITVWYTFPGVEFSLRTLLQPD